MEGGPPLSGLFDSGDSEQHIESIHAATLSGKAAIILRQRIFQRSVAGGAFAACLGLCLKVADSEDYAFKLNFLADILPDTIVLNCFIVFVSFITAARTSHALMRFTDAAMYLHQLNACWFDSASTLFAFCRASRQPKPIVNLFQQTLVRLVSLLNALCLEELQMRLEDPSEGAFQFEIIDLDSLDMSTQDLILDSQCKVEVVFQAIQQLVVDNIETGVLCIAAPILSRSFQELGAGLMKYHEAMKLVKERTPLSYKLLTWMMLLSCAVFFPFMLANSTRGLTSAFFMTFFAVFMLWYINQVADTLDNPFWKWSNTLDAESSQHELNEQLISLLKQSGACTPTIHALAKPKILHTTRSMSQSLQDWAARPVHRNSDLSGIVESEGHKEDEEDDWAPPGAELTPKAGDPAMEFRASGIRVLGDQGADGFHQPSQSPPHIDHLLEAPPPIPELPKTRRNSRLHGNIRASRNSALRPSMNGNGWSGSRPGTGNGGRPGTTSSSDGRGPLAMTAMLVRGTLSGPAQSSAAQSSESLDDGVTRNSSEGARKSVGHASATSGHSVDEHPATASRQSGRSRSHELQIVRVQTAESECLDLPESCGFEGKERRLEADNHRFDSAEHASGRAVAFRLVDADDESHNHDEQNLPGSTEMWV